MAPSKPFPDLISGPAAAAGLRAAFPDLAMSDVLDATRTLLNDSNAAYAAGRRRVPVPPVLAGGLLGWDAPAGAVRQQLGYRLDALVRTGQVQRRHADAVIARFGLNGMPGSARDARSSASRRRQATSNAISDTIRLIASDISMEPLMPIREPRLDLAMRQAIVGSVLSLMSGPDADFSTRVYAHMRVRAELLGDPAFPMQAAGASERQRRHRLAKRWLAIASDHLDRGELPFGLAPKPTSEDRLALEEWTGNGDRTVPPSVGATRALADSGEDGAVEALNDVKGALGVLLDGYRPLIELARVAEWAHAGPASTPWTRLDPAESAELRSFAVLAVAELFAARGYPDAAVLYAGRAHDVGGGEPLATSWLRFRRLIVLEGVSYLQGPTAVTKTRQWHSALVDHVVRHGAVHLGEPIAVAHALMRAEHAAWTAGVASGASVEELLQPLEEPLVASLASTSAENRRRFSISRARLAKVIGGQNSTDGADPAASVVAAASGDPQRHDEWYCAYPVAVARWDVRGNVRGQDEWRR